MTDKKILNKITMYAKFRGGKNYKASDSKRLISAYEAASPEMQQTYIEGMDLYIKAVRSGKVKSGQSLQHK